MTYHNEKEGFGKPKREGKFGKILNTLSKLTANTIFQYVLH